MSVVAVVLSDSHCSFEQILSILAHLGKDNEQVRSKKNISADRFYCDPSYVVNLFFLHTEIKVPVIQELAFIMLISRVPSHQQLCSVFRLFAEQVSY